MTTCILDCAGCATDAGSTEALCVSAAVAGSAEQGLEGGTAAALIWASDGRADSGLWKGSVVFSQKTSAPTLAGAAYSTITHLSCAFGIGAI